ncbi:UEV-domain-containing protein [Cystobasidium minutum MCA 4210]|uniref:UEV-domain-containing protein n=1 Tax=Cystobasidium minutum MCA 4210 TaxID=1397322 RepID=UPI0034CE5D42|eukprot:jgi/Rhomi1/95461/CE95460_1180
MANQYHSSSLNPITPKANGMALNAVQKWLQSILGPYRYRDEVYADVDRTLQAVPSLSPRTDTYTYDDGRTVLLLTLQGTIPISFRGATYNIPVAYWIPHAYPREAPIAYVVPASNMLVRQSANVDLSGLIKADFLQAWSRKWEGNNLLLLTETLQGIFSCEPPLYAKPTQPPPQQQNGYPPSPASPIAGPSRQTGPRPPPPPPVAPPSISGHAQQPQSPRSQSPYINRQHSLSPQHANSGSPSQQQTGPPGPPQKPWINGQSPNGPSGTTHQRSASMSGYNHASVPMNPAQQSQQYPQAPPRPPVPHAYEHARSPSTGHSVPARQPSLHIQPVSPSQQSANSPSAYQGQYSYQLQNQSPLSPATLHPVQHAPVSSQSSRPGLHSPFPSHTPPQPNLQPPFVQQSAYSTATPSNQSHQSQHMPATAPHVPPRPEALRNAPSPGPSKSQQRLATPVNILDDDDEPSRDLSKVSAPPPRPTNPALLNMRRALYAQLVHHLHTLQAHLNTENEHLRALHADLLKGEPAILDEMQRLEAVRDVCVSVRDRMSEVVGTAQNNIQDLSTRPEIEVDELICGTNVVHNQLLELVAEDNALEDAIYHLGRYFNSDTRNQDELERFLKRSRILAREQFMKRALVNKILLEIALSRAQRA